MKPIFTAIVAMLFAMTLAAGASGAPGADVGAPANHTTTGRAAATVGVQLLAINDFHGNLDPPEGWSGTLEDTEVGGAEYLATHIAGLEASQPNTVVVSAGDLIGASPLLSALFHDEPTIEAMNEIGLDLNAVGNHEFDEGSTELVRMQQGGCHPQDGCKADHDFPGAAFKFLAANVRYASTGKTVFPSYAIRKFGGVKVGFIGMTLEGTPELVVPSGVAGLTFADEARTANRVVGKLKDRGVEAIVVLLHEGGYTTGGYNSCEGISGPILDLVDRMKQEIDVVVSGHTHAAYNCEIDGRLVTSASSFGRLVTDIDLELDPATGEVVSAQANNLLVTRDVALDPEVQTLLDEYRSLAAPMANEVVGQITADILTTANEEGESALGDVIADSHLDATDDSGAGAAQIAFMNRGGIRADLMYAESEEEGDGNVTFEESFTVQPFGNTLVTMTLTGNQIDKVLEQQWVAGGSTRILQPSEGFSYSYDPLAPYGARVDIASITLDGIPLDPYAAYRVTVNSFLADGGDGFTMFSKGTYRTGGPLDLDALDAYFAAHSPVPPGPQDRIHLLPP